VVFGFPSSGGIAQDFTLPANLDLALSQFREERASGPFADKSVDVGNQVDRKGYLRRSAQTLRHTPSVT
jgi:hypothetical protein